METTTSGGAPTRRREPIFDLPAVVTAIVAALVAVYLTESLASEENLNFLLERFGFVPGHLTLSICPQAFWRLQSHAGDSPLAFEEAHAARAFLQERGLLAQASLGSGCVRPLSNFARLSFGDLSSLIAYAFLHLSWTHVLLNSIWIVAFGPPVARRIGALRFVIFFLAAAVAGALVHWAFNPLEFAPLAGASASDSGLMGAAARFIFEPGGPLDSPARYLASGRRADYDVAAPSLGALLGERRVLIFLAVWLVGNFVLGAWAQPLGLSDLPVAWLAHLGGFAFGFLAFPLFDRQRRGLRGLMT
ncbi:MAG TPA: rhomboid family intramembrane serine protease [Roseiarcus sp.]|nr:rhomboid family intramembrane serine protease [Roseiarcus sp.]